LWSSACCFKAPALARRQRLSAADREQYVFLPNHSFALLRQSRINNWQWPGRHVGHANGLVSGSWLYAPHTTVSRPADSLAYDSISPESSSIRHHAPHSTANKSTCVGSTCPPNSHEAVADRARRREGQRIVPKPDANTLYLIYLPPKRGLSALSQTIDSITMSAPTPE
jgi:hypothetical protein